MLYLHVLQLCIASEGKMDLTSLSKSFVVYEGWLHYNYPRDIDILLGLDGCQA